MDQSAVEEVKQVINMICLLQCRELEFREELDFFNQSWNKEELINEEHNFIQEINLKNVHRLQLSQALSRLAHEVMFLCIDVYSLYRGVQQNKSLYARIIKNSSKTFVKIDKSPIKPDTVRFLGIFTSNGIEEPSDEYKRKCIKFLNQESLTARKNLRDSIGPKSHDHAEMDRWRDSFLNKEVISKLEKYRNEFAHRLDSLDKIKEESKLYHPNYVQEMLDVISVVLDEYKSLLQGILRYTISEDYEGVWGLSYDSLSRIKEWRKKYKG